MVNHIQQFKLEINEVSSLYSDSILELFIRGECLVIGRIDKNIFFVELDCQNYTDTKDKEGIFGTNSIFYLLLVNTLPSE